MKIKRFLFFTVVVSCVLNTIYGQNSFEIWIDSELDEYSRDMLMNTDHDYVGIIWKITDDYSTKNHIYKVSKLGDTTSQFYSKQDTLLFLDKIIQVSSSPIEYLVSGIGFHQDSSASLWFSYFMKIDNSLNIVWEKVYHLHNVDEYACHPAYSQLLKLTTGGYLHGNYLQSHQKLFLFEMSDTGDSIAYRMYEGDSTGRITELTYNPDSTCYWVHISGGQYEPNSPECQCVEVNMQLQQFNVMNYPRYFRGEYTSKLLPNGNLVAASVYRNPWIPEEYITALKLDSEFNVMGVYNLTNPDTANQGGHKMIDFVYPSDIYFGGDHNYQIGIWVPGPSWFVIGKLNEDFELESELYIGGDATYNLKTITATADSGVLITGTWYDFDSQSYERDVIILKLSKDDLITGIVEEGLITVSTVIVYPNPGNDQLNIRTAKNNSQFKMWDIKGNLVIDKEINQLITNINTSSIKQGTYYWKLINEQGIIDTGKWIRTK